MNEWENRLLYAATHGKLVEAQKLLKFVSPDIRDCHTGHSVLSLAVKGGHTGVVKLLLEAGAKPTSSDAAGTSPLHIAAKDNNINCLKLLVLRNANIDMKTSSGLTPQDFTQYASEAWQILQDRKIGIMPVYREISEVPHIPAFAIANAVKEKKPKKAKKKSKKKKK